MPLLAQPVTILGVKFITPEITELRATEAPTSHATDKGSGASYLAKLLSQTTPHTHRSNIMPAASIRPSIEAPARWATRRDAAFPGRIADTTYPSANPFRA